MDKAEVILVENDLTGGYLAPQYAKQILLVLIFLGLLAQIYEALYITVNFLCSGDNISDYHN